jgi:hypothetical protein
MKFLKFEEFINEELKTKEVDASRFQNPGIKNDRAFFIKGKLDGNPNDDVVINKKIGIPAKSLKPSQKEVFLGKALDMAIRGYYGGDLGSIVSSDGRIIDGHHRWVATLFNDPNMKLICTKVDLVIGDLIPVLRQAGDVLGNIRGTKPETGDIDVFSATMKDVEDCIYRGKNMDPVKWNRENAEMWYASNKSTVEKALSIIKKNLPPSDAPERSEMPKIKSNQVEYVTNTLSSGKIDIRNPYAK